MRKVHTALRRSFSASISGFRLVRVFSIEHNTHRFKKHVDRLGRDPKTMRLVRRCRLKRRAHDAFRCRQALALAAAGG